MMRNNPGNNHLAVGKEYYNIYEHTSVTQSIDININVNDDIDNNNNDDCDNDIIVIIIELRCRKPTT